MWSSTWPGPLRLPLRAFGSRYGAFVMLSMPPATITSTEPAASMSCANIAARMPEPHILLTVVLPVASDRPAPSAAWRAGAWPWPAGSTQPITTSSICSGFSPACSTAAWIATEPSCGAVNAAKSPWNAAIGVRATETITTGSRCVSLMFQLLDHTFDYGGHVAQPGGIGGAALVVWLMRAGRPEGGPAKLISVVQAGLPGNR